jgi:hypothetical protein
MTTWQVIRLTMLGLVLLGTFVNGYQLFRLRRTPSLDRALTLLGRQIGYLGATVVVIALSRIWP